MDTGHPLYSVLAVSPNEHMSPVQFWEAMLASMLLRGNPSSFSRMPWSTRIKVRGAPKGFLSPALGPSVAYWFKQLTDNQTIRWTNIFLQQEFEKRIRQEIAKGAR